MGGCCAKPGQLPPPQESESGIHGIIQLSVFPPSISQRYVSQPSVPQLSLPDHLKQTIATRRNELTEYRWEQQYHESIVNYPLPHGCSSLNKPKELRGPFKSIKERHRHEKQVIGYSKKIIGRLKKRDIPHTEARLKDAETTLKLLLGRAYLDKKLQVHLIPDLANIVQTYIDINEEEMQEGVKEYHSSDNDFRWWME